MLKKRLIFTLLYEQEHFMLSRNFRLQKVGDLNWLQTNYNFSKVSFSIDELIVLDVTRGTRNILRFCEHLRALTEGCFVPIAAGGGIRSVDHARRLLRSGADKVVINTPLYDNPAFVNELATEFGQQCVVASMDVKKSKDAGYEIWAENGSRCLDGSAAEWVEKVSQYAVGEIYLNSIDRDGTGQGYDMQLLDLTPNSMQKTIILAGGAGKAQHLAEGLDDQRVDAVATAHLFNFVGDGLQQARSALLSSGYNLPVWNKQLFEESIEN